MFGIKFSEINPAYITAGAVLLSVVINQVIESMRRKDNQAKKGEDKYIERKILALDSSIGELEKVKFKIRQAQLNGILFLWSEEEAETNLIKLTDEYLKAIAPLVPYSYETPKIKLKYLDFLKFFFQMVNFVIDIQAGNSPKNKNIELTNNEKTIFKLSYMSTITENFHHLTLFLRSEKSYEMKKKDIIENLNKNEEWISGLQEQARAILQSLYEKNEIEKQAYFYMFITFLAIFIIFFSLGQLTYLLSKLI